MMAAWTLLLPILVPACGGVAVLLTPKGLAWLQNALALLASLGALVITALLFGQELDFNASWAGFGMDFSLRLYSLSSFILLVAAFCFLTLVYSAVFMQGKPRQRQFLAWTLLTSAFVCGAMLANNLVLMLFFWEGLLGLLFAMILANGNESAPTAIKALVINGTADLCLIFGICLFAWRSGTLAMDQAALTLDSLWNNVAFIMMMIGAIAKAGSLPFHSWIPDAASDAPLPFMALLPGALEKITGIYLLVRINLDLFQLLPGSPLSLTMMVIGCCTILIAVLMALIQKDYKRLLAYHAVSQVGYMILGIGTALPIGIVGGLFHMVNNAVYKSCLFFTAGAVERQTGTTDLHKLGGLGRSMPLTCAGFLIAALAITGVPPLNGFFSKELVFDAALEVHVGFYLAALLGAFGTAASFLKLGHSVYFGRMKTAAKNVTEAPWAMLAPILFLAFVCVLFGVYNPLPLQGLIEPVLGESLEHTLSGLPHSWLLVAISAAVLLLALANHNYGVRRSGEPLGAVDHIHYAPVMKTVYGWAEAGLLDPYNICGRVMDVFSRILFLIDRAIDWVYSTLAPTLADWISLGINKAHVERPYMSVLWILGGAAFVALLFIWMGG